MAFNSQSARPVFLLVVICIISFGSPWPSTLDCKLLSDFLLLDGCPTTDVTDAVSATTSPQGECYPAVSLPRNKFRLQPILDMATRDSLLLFCKSCRPVQVALAANDQLDNDYMLLIIQNRKNRTIIRQNCKSHSRNCGAKAKVHHPRVLSCDSFESIWISWSWDTVSVGRGVNVGADVILSHRDIIDGINDVNYIFMATSREDTAVPQCYVDAPYPPEYCNPPVKTTASKDNTTKTNTTTTTKEYETTPYSLSSTTDSITTELTSSETTVKATTTKGKDETDTTTSGTVTTNKNKETTSHSLITTVDDETTELTVLETTENPTTKAKGETVTTTTGTVTTTEDEETTTHTITTTANNTTTNTTSIKTTENTINTENDDTSSQTTSTTTSDDVTTTTQETKTITEIITTSQHVTTATADEETTEQNSKKNTENTTVAPVRYSYEHSHCKCIRKDRPANKTAEEKEMMEKKKQELVQEIKQNLTIPATNVSATRRRYISAKDDRHSSKCIAMVMAIVCFSPLMVLVLSDGLRFFVSLYEVGRRCLRTV